MLFGMPYFNGFVLTHSNCYSLLIEMSLESYALPVLKIFFSLSLSPLNMPLSLSYPLFQIKDFRGQLIFPIDRRICWKSTC